MNAETFAQWMKGHGHRVIRTESSYWYDAGPRAYQAFPYSRLICPSEQELRELMLKHGILALRYSAPVNEPVGSISYHAVLGKSNYTLDILERQVKRNVTLGLQNCRVEPISFERLAEEGWLLELDTLDRQGRRAQEDEATWRKRCELAASLPGFEAWGALVDGHLGATVLTFQMEDCCEMISQQSHRNYLSARANNALIFVVTQTMLNRPDIRSIFYTVQSLDAPASIDEFKFRMGYAAKPVRQRVVFHPWLAPFFNQFSYMLVKQIRKLDPANCTLAKGEGMLRFYLQGKQPLDKQAWPSVLEDRKAEYCLTAAATGQIRTGRENESI